MVVKSYQLVYFMHKTGLLEMLHQHSELRRSMRIFHLHLWNLLKEIIVKPVSNGATEISRPPLDLTIVFDPGHGRGRFYQGGLPQFSRYKLSAMLAARSFFFFDFLSCSP